MKKIFLVVITLLTMTVSVYSQKSFSLGVYGGYDYNMNHLGGLTNFTNKTPDFSIGADWAFLFLNEDLRARIGLGYSNVSFNQDYSYTSENPLTVDRTHYVFNNLNVTPRADYRLLKLGNFDLYASLGLELEFLIYKYEGTFLKDGSYDDSSFWKKENAKTSAGVIGGFIFKYNFNDKIGLTVSPDYTYFFNEFIAIDNDYDFQRASLNIGLEWKF